MDRAGERHGVAPARRYRDYREMLERERPDIVSVATQPEQRAAIVIWACEHGARATYAEEPMAASMEQADAMVAAVERHGVAAFASDTGRAFELEVVCEHAVISSLGGDSEFLLREAGGVSHRVHPALRPGTFPPFTRSSSTANLIMDLVRALDTGGPPTGGVRIARANLELIFACIESHRRGGARVAVPLVGSDLAWSATLPPASRASSADAPRPASGRAVAIADTLLLTAGVAQA